MLLGINLLIEQAGVTNIVALTDPGGAASYAMNLPAANVAFCGVDIFGQWLVADTGAANGLASTTDGLQLTLGAW